MRLILPERDLAALKARVEQQFANTMEGRWSEMRGGSYLRWPIARPSLRTRIRLKLRRETAPFRELLLFRNSEVDDPEPFYPGHDPDCILVDLDGDMEGQAAGWFISNEAAIAV